MSIGTTALKTAVGVMNVPQKEVQKIEYDHDNKIWQINTYERNLLFNEERLVNSQPIPKEEIDRIGYDADGNLILRDASTAAQRESSSIKKNEDLHHVTVGSSFKRVGLSALEVGLDLASGKRGEAVVPIARLAFDPFGSWGGRGIRNMIVKSGHYKFLPSVEERKHPAAMRMEIAHDRTSWGALLGNILKWTGRIAGALAGVAIIVATGGTALIAAGITAAVIVAAGETAETVTHSATDNVAKVSGQIIEGSPNVFFNGDKAARLGDKVLCQDHPDHANNVFIEGSKTVFINGKPMVRVGHKTSCGAFAFQGVDYAYTGLLTTTYAAPDKNSYERWNEIFKAFELVRGVATLGRSIRDGGRWVEEGGLEKLTQKGNDLSRRGQNWLQARTRNPQGVTTAGGAPSSPLPPPYRTLHEASYTPSPPYQMGWPAPNYQVNPAPKTYQMNHAPATYQMNYTPMNNQTNYASFPHRAADYAAANNFPIGYKSPYQMKSINVQYAP